MSSSEDRNFTNSKKRKSGDSTDPERAERKRQKKLRKELERVEEAPAPLNSAPSSSLTSKEKKRSKPRNTAVPGDETVGSDTVLSSRQGMSTPSPKAGESADFFQSHGITIHDGTIIPITAFGELDVPSRLRPALAAFSKPTPIQSCAWPALLAGKDVIGIAETGSGKTMAFALPAAAHLLKLPKASKPQSISVIVLSPTRELAIQSHETFEKILEPLGFASVCVYGGARRTGQSDALKGSSRCPVRVVVATPGRLLDFLQDGTVSLKEVSYLVLDEADRMLDNGFENDIQQIISLTIQGAGRQTLMFSATWPESVRRLASTFLRKPVRITVGSEDLTANKRVEQIVEVLDDGRQKDSRLLNVLRGFDLPKGQGKISKPNNTRVLVFCLYKKEAARVEENLQRMGYRVAAIHGDLNQNAREAALADFKSGDAGLLIATDVAARGLDIPDVNMVVNYTFPLTTEDYVHRIGRTGRAGKSGRSHTLFTGEGHERALAGELARVLHDSGFSCDDLKKFPMTVKKKEHSAYGAFYKDIGSGPKTGTKIKF